MTTYYSDAVGAGVTERTSLGTNSVIGKFNLTAALAKDDVIKMVKIPAGATICDVIIMSTDLDTGGTPAIVMSVFSGDLDDFANAAVFIDGTTVGKTAGVDRLNSDLGYKFTEAKTIDIVVDTAPATGATTGTITLCVQYHMEGFN